MSMHNCITFTSVYYVIPFWPVDCSQHEQEAQLMLTYPRDGSVGLRSK